MYSVNMFKGGVWNGHILEASKREAITSATLLYQTGEYSAVNVESPSGTVVFVRKAGKR